MSESQPPSPRDPDRAPPGRTSWFGAPAPLALAALLTLLQGLVTVGLGVAETVHVHSDRLVMGATTALFFVVYGVALAGCAWGLATVRAWARGPVLLAQLLWLGLAWSFRDGDTLPVAVVLLVAAVLVLAGLLHPRSIEALERSAGRSADQRGD